MADDCEIVQQKLFQHTSTSQTNFGDTFFLIDEENEEEGLLHKYRLTVKKVHSVSVHSSDLFFSVIASQKIKYVDVFLAQKSTSIFIVNRVIRL